MLVLWATQKRFYMLRAVLNSWSTQLCNALCYMPIRTHSRVAATCPKVVGEWCCRDSHWSDRCTTTTHPL